MIQADYIVVGAGLTGATCARILADAGRDVLVLDRRDRVGGNCTDTLHPSGVRVHDRGPHYFRTNDARIWDWVRRFDGFYRWEAKVWIMVDGELHPWPLQRASIERIARNAGKSFSSGIDGGDNFEGACLKRFPAPVYLKAIKPYTERQWGVPARTLSASLANRIEIREDGDDRFSLHRFQGLPQNGYSAWTRAMLDGVPKCLNFDWLRCRDEVNAKVATIYTGPLDELFGFDLGRLKYRGQARRTEFDKVGLRCGQVNDPSAPDGSIRKIDWGWMLPPGQRSNGTAITTEVPWTPTDMDSCEYPFPDAANQALAARYKARASQNPKLILAGRLGTYRYLDMDQAIGQAMAICRERFGLEARS